MKLVVDPAVFDPRLAQREEGLPKPGTLIAQRYRIGEGIGTGGMSVLFLARDERLGRDVALKLLNPQLASSFEIVTRFVNEARTLAQLDCPHVVRVFDAGVADEPGHLPLPFMVLELLRGIELRAVAAATNAEEVQRIIDWMLQICDGLAAAHAEGIIHRDLKPENLFVVDETDGNRIAKVLDFGIARSMEVASSLTFDGERMGSPGYMSPEQIRDASSVDERSDIWSLGVIMYELFASSAPFQSESALELCVQILHGAVTPLGTHCPDLPPGLIAVIDRCMQRPVEARFDNIADLADALAPYAHPSALEIAARVRRRLRARTMPPVSAEPSSAPPPAPSTKQPLPQPRLPAVHDASLLVAPKSRTRGARQYRAPLAVAAVLAVGSCSIAVYSSQAAMQSGGFVANAGARLRHVAQGIVGK